MDDLVLARSPVLPLAAPVGARAGPAVRVVAEGEQRGHVVVGFRFDIYWAPPRLVPTRFWIRQHLA